MENLEWLNKVKKLDVDQNYDVIKNAQNVERYLNFRKVKALEIIAEESMGIKEELSIIASCAMAIKNLQ